MTERIEMADAELYEAVCKTVGRGEVFALIPKGRSMEPTVYSERQTVFLVSPDKIGRGDIVFYKRQSGKLILHRIIKECDDGSFVMRGDSQLKPEADVMPGQIFALVDSYTKKSGRLVRRGSFRYRADRLYASVFTPVKSFLWRIASKIGIVKKNNG